MNLVGYVRVSTANQVEEGFGLDVQREQILAWTTRSGHRLVGWFVDEGVSGAKEVDERTGLAAALQTLCDGSAHGLVTAKLDRFARSLTVQEAALALAWRCGGRVFTADTGEVFRDDPDDPMRTAMRQMVGVFSELERRMISKRLRDGRRYKHEQGRYAYGAPAFGVRSDPDSRELVDDEREQVTVERIKELHQAGLSIREIASKLNQEGHRPKRADAWNPGTLSRVIRRLEAEG
ncbi:MAG: recombinase family protein [Actinomycetota bacterium]|nr:recombinase family protein [Actinomycetota bacterium]